MEVCHPSFVRCWHKLSSGQGIVDSNIRHEAVPVPPGSCPFSDEDRSLFEHGFEMLKKSGDLPSGYGVTSAELGEDGFDDQEEIIAVYKKLVKTQINTKSAQIEAWNLWGPYLGNNSLNRPDFFCNRLGYIRRRARCPHFPRFHHISDFYNFRLKTDFSVTLQSITQEIVPRSSQDFHGLLLWPIGRARFIYTCIYWLVRTFIWAAHRIFTH